MILTISLLKSKDGPFKRYFGKNPGIANQLDNINIDDRQIDWTQAIILSMTPEERSNPSLLNPSRKEELQPVQAEVLKKSTDLSNSLSKCKDDETT